MPSLSLEFSKELGMDIIRTLELVRLKKIFVKRKLIGLKPNTIKIMMNNSLKVLRFFQ